MYIHTVHVLLCRYANRAKNIKNKPRINEDPKDALLREYQEEIRRLTQALEKRKKKSGKNKKKRKRVGPDGKGFVLFFRSGKIVMSRYLRTQWR